MCDVKVLMAPLAERDNFDRFLYRHFDSFGLPIATG